MRRRGGYGAMIPKIGEKVNLSALQGEGNPVGVHDDTPIQVTPGQAVDEQLGGGHVGGHRHGVLVAQAGDIHDILILSLIHI